jgi:hypothetical protein
MNGVELSSRARHIVTDMWGRVDQMHQILQNGDKNIYANKNRAWLTQLPITKEEEKMARDPVNMKKVEIISELNSIIAQLETQPDTPLRNTMKVGKPELAQDLILGRQLLQQEIFHKRQADAYANRIVQDAIDRVAAQENLQASASGVCALLSGLDDEFQIQPALHAGTDMCVRVCGWTCEFMCLGANERVDMCMNIRMYVVAFDRTCAWVGVYI